MTNDKERIKNTIENGNYRDLIGLEIEVDDLQLLLSKLGWERGEVGDSEWYRNVAENINGYIAELQAVKDDKTLTIVVDGLDGFYPMIKDVDVE